MGKTNDELKKFVIDAPTTATTPQVNKFDLMTSPKNIVLDDASLTERFAHKALESFTSPVRAAENALQWLGDMRGTGKQVQSVVPLSEYVIPAAENFGERAADFAGRVFGEIPRAFMFDLGNSTDVGKAIVNKVGNNIPGKILAGAADKAVLEVPENVMENVSIHKDVAGVAKGIAQDTIGSAITGGFLSGAGALFGKIGSKYAKNADEAAKAAQEAAKQARIQKAVSNPTNDVYETLDVSADSSFKPVSDISKSDGAFNMDKVADNLVMVNNTAMTAREYANAVENILPNSVDELSQTISKLESVPPKSRTLEVNLQLFAAQQKLERLTLSERPVGNTVRGFMEQAQNSDRFTPEQQAMFRDNPDTYNVKSDVALGEQADDLIRTPESKNALYNKIMNLQEGELLNDVEVSAAKKMIDELSESQNTGELLDLVRGVSRSGTDTGRALRQYALDSYSNPQSALKQLIDVADENIDIKTGIKGASKGLDKAVSDIADKSPKRAQKT